MRPKRCAARRSSRWSRSTRSRATPSAASIAWRAPGRGPRMRSEEHTSELQSHHDLVCRLLLEKKKCIVAAGFIRSVPTFVVFAWRANDEYVIPAAEVARIERADLSGRRDMHRLGGSDLLPNRS